ncbi:hypothetical protein [Alicyclobacillus sp. ALC3]|uniref:hypothetical protein n=1 Tax=Alicyclobacillus sp. ALC3 TaxID=2796143 RepID=UPI0023780E37|nr:hypothetical protein [Alicyclobacillus sp. ALC3]WDL96680.1 hypothetical protein JC200_20615 [Alicyclobacillus sp. ALC3]
MVEFRLATMNDAEIVHSITQDAWEEYRHRPGSSSALNETSEQIRSILASGEELAALGFLNREAVLAVRFRLSDHL